MKEFEAKVVIVCMILGFVLMGLALVIAEDYPEEKLENNVVVEEEENW